MGRLWDIVQAHIDAQKYPPSQAKVAAELGIKSATTLSNWKQSRLKEMPKREHLWAVADLKGASIHRVLEAALQDAGRYERGGRDAAPKGAQKRPTAETKAAAERLRSSRPRQVQQQ